MYLEDILSEKLPDYSEDEFLLSVDEIDTTNVGKGDFEELSDFEGVVGVLNLDNSALGRLGDLLPVDTSWEKLIFKLTDNEEVLREGGKFRPSCPRRGCGCSSSQC
jgi:hypothetical protein